MKKCLSNVCLILVVLIFASCGTNHTSSGRPYEILVVIGHDTWESPAGRALYDVLNTDIPGLPQSERYFRIMHTPMSSFDSTMKLVRNVIIVAIKDIYTKAAFKIARNVYASPQLILTIQAPDRQSFEQFVEENGQQIVDLFTKAEMNRQIAALESKHNGYINNYVKENFDSEIWLPAELNTSKVGDDFFWASNNTATGHQNFVIYSYPYTDKDTFTKEYFIHKRDSFMQANIPGSFPDSYMSTDSLFTEVKPINVQGEYALEARGLWRMRGGDFMGGPFVSHTRLDKENNRIITTEVFVYSPDKKKGNMMRNLESSLYTLRLPGALDPNPVREEVNIEE